MLLFGVAEADLPRVLDSIEEVTATKNVRPVIITSSERLDLIGRRKIAVEYVPPCAGGLDGEERDWDLYLKHRFELLSRKWDPGDVLAYGPGSADVARIWRNAVLAESRSDP